MSLAIHAVLAGAYSGRLQGRTLLTHALLKGATTTLCRRIPAEHLCDLIEPSPPTCPVCATRYAKLTKGA